MQKNFEIFPKNEVIRYDPNVGPSDTVLSMPHYHRVVKGTGVPGCEKHLAYREKILDGCKRSNRFREQALDMAREDMLWWFNTFCMLFEPRDTSATQLRPFNTWPHQDELIAHIQKYMGRRMIGVEKSRGEGASWIVLMCFLHNWLFYPMRSFGLVSKDERSVNDIKNSGSLTYKILWQIRQMEKRCPWMLPRGWKEDIYFTTSKGGTFYNPELESTINGYSATGSVASGDRKTAFLMDELSKFPRPDDKNAMASTQPVTDCRIVVSTPYGDSGAYYDCMHTKDSTMLKIVLHWPMNPTRNEGLYKWPKENDRPILLDHGYEYPPQYEFVQDGTLRSPWYDAQAALPDMKNDPRAMAQEYDLNYGGSMVKFYDAGLREMLEKNVRPPSRIGDIDYDEFGSVGIWNDCHWGKCWNWMPMSKGRPPQGMYVMGVDVASGLANRSCSNSAIIVLDADSGSQVFEWKDNATRPSECAQLAVAIAKWLTIGGNYPLMVWDANGPLGEEFTNEIMSNLQYPNPYYRFSYVKSRKKRTKKPGYHTSHPGSMHEKTRKFLNEGRASICSEDLLNELSQFEYRGAKVEHNQSLLKEDGATGLTHGDIVTALCMAIIGLDDIGGGSRVKPELDLTARIIPENSLGQRMLRKQRELQDQRRNLNRIGWKV